MLTVTDMTFKLSRFPADKQDQIEQLIGYAQLLGLTGRDLVSIGGKMDREASKDKKISNMAIVSEFTCLLIGRDRGTHALEHRFKLKTIDGAYNFSADNDRYEIHSLKTNQRRSHRVNEAMYDLPRVSYRTRLRYAMLLDIAADQFRLDF